MSEISSSDALSLLSFYLALVALLSSIFFTRLESWYNDVRVAAKLWDLEPKINPDLLSINDHVEKLISLQSSKPIIGFLLVLSFLILISIFGALLGNMIPDSSIPLSFIFVPGVIFDSIFLVVSIYLLVSGEGRIKRTLAEVDRVLGK